MSIFETLKESLTQTHAKQYREYVALLESDSSSPRDAARLQELLKSLRITVEQAQLDQDALHQVAATFGLIKRGTGLERERQQAEQALAEAEAEWQRLDAEMVAKVNPLRLRVMELRDRNFTAQTAIGTLATLKKHNPDLLAHVPSLTHDDLIGK